jgi:endoglucanase
MSAHRILLALLVATVALAGPPATASEPLDGWDAFKARFLDDGRIVDTGNGNVSHSEGQGWGMLFAEASGDREAFDAIWAWTRANLAVRDDALFAWRWFPDKPEAPVPDTNNASDGDLYVAWALLRAADRWDEADYEAAARRILDDLRECCVLSYGGHDILLPGATGFSHADHVAINLSYWVFPAFQEIGQRSGLDAWNALTTSGRELLVKARFGRWVLPADWTRLNPDGSVALADGFPPRFAYDAIRVPLFLAWADIGDASLIQPFERFVQETASYPVLPAWTNLDDDSIASYARGPGFQACLLMARRAYAKLTGAAVPADAIPLMTPEQSYYTSSLVMLARLAEAERAR